MYKQTIVGLSVYSPVIYGLTLVKNRPLAPHPSPVRYGGVTQNFRTIPCVDCDDGWIRQPDGYGCVEWTLCYRCGGSGQLEDRGDD
jgi:hypothetical protein